MGAFPETRRNFFFRERNSVVSDPNATQSWHEPCFYIQLAVLLFYPENRRQTAEGEAPPGPSALYILLWD